MEIGALICKPKNPYCEKCPLIKDCLSYRNNDFELEKKNKKIVDKFYVATLYKNNNKILLIKNDKFKFLKNLLIFPMKEITKSNFLPKYNNRLNLRISKINMNIYIDFLKKKKKLKNGLWITKKNFENYMIPTFTKKIFYFVKNTL